MVREWDPRTASSAEISSLLDCLNQVFRTDLPGDPLWRPHFLREYLTETMPGVRRICWLAEQPDARGGTEVVGHVNVLLLGDIGVLEILVRPDVRRTGLGRQLLSLAVRRAYHEGFSSVGVEVIGGTCAVEFYESFGFARQFREIRSVLRLASVDWAAIEKMAQDTVSGYEVEFHPGGPPDDLVEAYARTKAEQSDPADGDLDLRPSSYEPERLRESLGCLHRRGMTPYIVLARHPASGEVAGLTEVVVPAQHPTRADQYDTIVAQAHQGRGIDRAIKARMLLELRAVEPALAEVQTWNAEGDEEIVSINTEIGYRSDRDWWDYGADIPMLMHRLGVRS
ncbi:MULTISPECIES: GNAT family N-acetyltransferase [unclassified Solwaraspora]|uniref:GNAT family N-acetyltransferase n=1 Tax=unclassified Solwaraspora TaxID=2627926 RepID=UPI00259B2D9E|nr:GNAT family N-acetyltransferase [Solwaraspora sp. WMMA2056]WJK44207.1 GNAT family N-acetyltransferase [Solwaraspora sp. WMMA2056]WJK44209.1 GNAT family N-acetyltransferase [Solwaraspora sp. WMMA2056]